MYVDLDTSTWANGKKEVLQPAPPDLVAKGYKYIVATDINRWRGTFTGKDGINSLEDFKSQKADAIAKTDFTYKYNNMNKVFEERLKERGNR